MLPIVEVATTEPLPLTERSELEIPVRARLVVVAEVVVALVIKASVKVEEAVERNPLSKARVVEVACSLVESLLNGYANVMEFR